MVAAALTDLLGLVAIVAVCGAMAFIAFRIEPHWVARDQSRFLKVAQELDQYGLPIGRKQEVRVRISSDDDSLHLSKRSIVRPSSGIWYVNAKSPTSPKGRVVYILKKITSEQEVGLMALRLPDSSKVIPRLEELLEATGEEAAARRRIARRAAIAESRQPSAEPAAEPPAQPSAEPN